MPPLIHLKNVSLSFGDRPLLEHVDFAIEPAERICLVGRNGAGKSTLLRLLMGEIQADDGETWQQDGLQLASLDQEVPRDDKRSVFEVVASGLGNLGDLISSYHKTIAEL